MNIQQAKLAGLKAFESGKNRAPALNQQFLKDACGHGITADLMSAYIKGWDVANLANKANPEAPSIDAYISIKANIQGE